MNDNITPEPDCDTCKDKYICNQLQCDKMNDDTIPYKLLTYEEAVILPDVKERMIKAGIDTNNPDYVEYFTRLYLRDMNYAQGNEELFESVFKEKLKRDKRFLGI